MGVGGAAAATSMAGMTGMAATVSGHPGGALGVLVRIGPWLIVVSAPLVTAAFALSRRPAARRPRARGRWAAAPSARQPSWATLIQHDGHPAGTVDRPR